MGIRERRRRPPPWTGSSRPTVRATSWSSSCPRTSCCPASWGVPARVIARTTRRRSSPRGSRSTGTRSRTSAGTTARGSGAWTGSAPSTRSPGGSWTTCAAQTEGVAGGGPGGGGGGCWGPIPPAGWTAATVRSSHVFSARRQPSPAPGGDLDRDAGAGGPTGGRDGDAHRHLRLRTEAAGQVRLPHRSGLEDQHAGLVLLGDGIEGRQRGQDRRPDLILRHGRLQLRALHRPSSLRVTRRPEQDTPPHGAPLPGRTGSARSLADLAVDGLLGQHDQVGSGAGPADVQVLV